MEGLSNSQREHWERQLESARKAVEVAEKMLGIIAVKEVHEHEESDENRDNQSHPL